MRSMAVARQGLPGRRRLRRGTAHPRGVELPWPARRLGHARGGIRVSHWSREGVRLYRLITGGVDGRQWE
eukprot:4093975-Pyramimonas_sp.AAC.1